MPEEIKEPIVNPDMITVRNTYDYIYTAAYLLLLKELGEDKARRKASIFAVKNTWVTYIEIKGML